MNPNNYTSLEMSRKLVEARIHLYHIDMVWCIFTDGRIVLMTDQEAKKIVHQKNVKELRSAPSMSELWRELPKGFDYKDNWAEICMVKSRMDDLTYCSYNLPKDKSVCGSVKRNTNPCDALAELLVWAVGNDNKMVDKSTGYEIDNRLD
jgi:hypothetical protein